ncbi:hypothetical protein EON66_10750 [archaeon]|nr:MAG: hypothetical protein EON66_10750 [archaeon]
MHVQRHGGVRKQHVRSAPDTHRLHSAHAARPHGRSRRNEIAGVLFMFPVSCGDGWLRQRAAFKAMLGSSTLPVPAGSSSKQICKMGSEHACTHTMVRPASACAHVLPASGLHTPRVPKRDGALPSGCVLSVVARAKGVERFVAVCAAHFLPTRARARHRTKPCTPAPNPHCRQVSNTGAGGVPTRGYLQLSPMPAPGFSVSHFASGHEDAVGWEAGGAEMSRTWVVDASLCWHDAYDVPALYFTLTNEAGELAALTDVAAWLGPRLEAGGSTGRAVGDLPPLSMTWHPITRSLCMLVHPCNTAARMRELLAAHHGSRVADFLLPADAATEAAGVGAARPSADRDNDTPASYVAAWCSAFLPLLHVRVDPLFALHLRSDLT